MSGTLNNTLPELPLVNDDETYKYWSPDDIISTPPDDEDDIPGTDEDNWDLDLQLALQMQAQNPGFMRKKDVDDNSSTHLRLTNPDVHELDGFEIVPRPQTQTSGSDTSEDENEYVEQDLLDDILDNLDSGDEQQMASTLAEIFACSDTTSASSTSQPSCIACGASSSTHNLHTAPCGHNWCLPDLNAMFTRSTQDQTFYPPTCCQQPISLSQVRHLLNPKLVEVFKQKRLEYETGDQTFCHHIVCGRFILPHNVEGGVGTCAGCGRRTCVGCKLASHRGGCLGVGSGGRESFGLVRRVGSFLRRVWR